jgi:hypothetical protein
MVHIKAKTLSQKVYEVDINSGSSVLELKNELSKVMENKIIDNEYKIILLGKVLNDDEIINDEHESKLFIVMTTKKKVEEKPVLPKNLPQQLPQQLPQIQQIQQIQQLPQIQQLQEQLQQLPQENQDILNNLVNNLMNQIQGNPELLNNVMHQLNFPIDDDSENEDNDNEEEDNDNVNDNYNYNEEEMPDDNANEGEVPDNANEGEVPDNQQFNAAMIGEFSNNEVAEVNEIVSMGFDYVEVFQMYIATGKNKEATLNILLE